MNDFKIRYLETDTETQMLIKWWNDWKFPVPHGFLSTRILIISKDDQDICAASLIATDTKIAWLDWFISDKQIKNRKLRKEALNFLIIKSQSLAGYLGFTALVSCISEKKNPSLNKILTNNDFVKDKTITMFHKKIKE